MLLVDVLRGEDSTGVILVEKDSSFTMMKDMWEPWYVIPAIKDSSHGKAMFTRGKAFIGHNRKATIGTVTSDTAHPFVVNDRFAMVHNGTLRNHKQLSDTAVDSEALAKHLEPILGPDYTKEKFEEAIGKVEGAYAVVAYNQLTHKVYMFRNSERPLCLIESKEAFFFGSEWGMLQWCAGRNGNNLKDADLKVLKHDTLYVVDLETNTITEEEYVPKKATPPSRITHTTGGMKGWKVSTGTNTEGGLSKNEQKRFRKKLIGRTISFWADDFVEKNFPNTLAQGETNITIMGASEDIGHHHFVMGEFDVNELNDGKILDRLYSGRIDDLNYNPTTHSFSIFLVNIQATPISNAKETPATVH